MKLALIITTLLFSSFISQAQKIKYKNLYVLLRAKNYKDASSFLNTYLITNPEHPNANYQMGLMLEFKLNELDLLKESEEINARADSAISYFNKAYTFITPKEVRKHDDDYYELFKRRNLRSGKFEVILSDVQLDIENRKNSLRNKKVDIALINLKFNNSVTFYEKARANYRNLRDAYLDELSLSMGAVDTTVSVINNMISEYDSALNSFKGYKRLKKSFDASSGETIVTNEPLKDFDRAALRKPYFYAKKVDFYNFSEWGTQQLTNINGHKSFINNLIAFDESLENLANKISADSADLSSEVFKKITLPVLKELKSLDPESLMMDIFQYKISQLNYSSSLMGWYSQYADTVDVGLQIDYVDKLINQLDGITRLEAALHDYDETIFMLRYHRLYEERYSSKKELFNYVNSQAALVKSQEEDVVAFLRVVEEKDKWGYWNQDTLSLSLVNDPLKEYSTFYSDSLENRAYRIAGLTQKENKKYLYFGAVPSSRVVDSLYFVETTIESMDLNSTEFIVQNHNTTPDHTVYLIGIPKTDKFNLQLVYISNTRGIIWNTSLQLDTTTPPQLNYVDNQIEIIQGDIVLKYQEDSGILIKE